MSLRNWLTGRSAAEQRVDELTAHVEKLRDEMHNLEAKIAEYRRLGMNPSEYETMYIQVRHMYDEARIMLRSAMAAWESER